MLTDMVCEFDIRQRDGGVLPPFKAGGSLIVHTPGGERRNYSPEAHHKPWATGAVMASGRFVRALWRNVAA